MAFLPPASANSDRYVLKSRYFSCQGGMGSQKCIGSFVAKSSPPGMNTSGCCLRYSASDVLPDFAAPTRKKFGSGTRVRQCLGTARQSFLHRQTHVLPFDCATRGATALSYDAGCVMAFRRLSGRMSVQTPLM